MTVFLICMIPVSTFMGFMPCALLQAASAADHREEKYFELKSKEQEEKTT